MPPGGEAQVRWGWGVKTGEEKIGPATRGPQGREEGTTKTT